MIEAEKVRYPILLVSNLAVNPETITLIIPLTIFYSYH